MKVHKELIELKVHLEIAFYYLFFRKQVDKKKIMEKNYNIIIIGTGTACSTFADKVSRSGLKIAIIDSREYGGVSPPRGCDSKKIFTDIAEVTDRNNRLIGKGAGLQNPIKIDWPSLIKFKETSTEECPERIENYFVEKGIDTYHGRAYFENQNIVVVGDDKLKGEYFWLFAVLCG